jgi:hypothetical protein
MPIRINLLAEALAAKDSRRRDPIKRIIIWGVLAAALMLLWWSWLELKVIVTNQDLSRIKAQIQSHTSTSQFVLASHATITRANEKLAALQKLTQSRFLEGNLMNALQQTTVNGVQLVRLRVDQTYFANEATAPQTNGTSITPGQPGTVTEKIVVSLDARDYSSNPGDLVNKFKDAISQQPYFQAELNKTNGVRLMNRSPPQVGTDGKTSVMFTLQCYYTDQTR